MLRVRRKCVIFRSNFRLVGDVPIPVSTVEYIILNIAVFFAQLSYYILYLAHVFSYYDALPSFFSLLTFVLLDKLIVIALLPNVSERLY